MLGQPETLGVSEMLECFTEGGMAAETGALSPIAVVRGVASLIGGCCPSPIVRGVASDWGLSPLIVVVWGVAGGVASHSR